MQRTQLYLDEDMLECLRNQASRQNTTISELVRAAIRESYFGQQEKRMKAMEQFIGIRKHRSDPIDSSDYIRSLRRGDRLERLSTDK